MTKASTSFLILIFAILFFSLSTYAQAQPPREQDSGTGQWREVRNSLYPSQRTIRGEVNQNLRPYERLRVSELFRLTYDESRELQLRSLTLVGQGHGYRVRIELLQNGRMIDTQILSRHSGEAFFLIPSGPILEELEISVSSEMFLSTVSVEVTSSRYPGPGPRPTPIPGSEQPVTAFSSLSLRLNQNIRGPALISIDRLLRQQLRLYLDGAEIEQVIVQGQSLGYERVASIQIELNNRPVSDVRHLKTISRLETYNIYSREETRSLDLKVNGDVFISEVQIRIGRVRPRFPDSSRMRYIVGQEISPSFPIELSRFIGPVPRRIRSVLIEARAIRPMEVQLSLLTRYGESQGTLFVEPNFIRATLPLNRPFYASDLRLEALSFIHVEAVEVEFESSRHF